MTTHRTAPDPDQKGWPGGIKYIIGNEGCERFSYYGMKAILYIYVVGLFINLEGMVEEEAKHHATEITHTFNAAVYALPLIGALIADRLLGKYQTIIWLSIVYCLGHLALALFESPGLQMDVLGISDPRDVPIDPIMGLYIGLGLIAAGSGGIKPCVSAHVGDQFGKSNWHLIHKVYNAFYFIINFGSAFATIIIPEIRGDLGVMNEMGQCVPQLSGAATEMIYPVCYTGSVGWAFGLPGILMGLATIAFWMGRRKFIHVPPHPGRYLGFLDVLSGSFLASVILFPMFITGLLSKLGYGLSGLGTGLVMLSFFGLHLLVFRYRQKREEDDGVLAIIYFSVRQSYGGLRRRIAAIVATLDTLTMVCAILILASISWTNAAGGSEILVTMGAFAALTLTLDRMRRWLAPDRGIFAAVGRSMSRARHDGPSEEAPVGFFGPAVDKHGAGVVDGPIAVLKILSVFLMVSVFWGLFDQHSTTWIQQAKDMNRDLGQALFTFDPSALYGLSFSNAGDLIMEWLLIGLGVGLTFGLTAAVSFKKRSHRMIGLVLGVGAGLAVGYYAYVSGGYFQIKASQVSSVNPFMVMLLIPLTTFGLYPLMERWGLTPHPLRRMTIGMFMAALAFVSVAFVQIALEDAQAKGETIHVAWQLIPYFIMTLSEVMVSITGLQFGYSQAPKRVKSVIMGLWLMMVSLGNVLVAFVAQYRLDPVDFFWLFAVLMAIAAAIFGLRAAFYTYKDNPQ